MGPIIKFSYLGERDYLDITSILDSLWDHFGIGFRQDVKDMHFKLLAPISQNCFLVYGPECNFKKNAENAVAEFAWTVHQIKYLGQLFQNGEVISIRLPEPRWNFAEYCDFQNDTVTLKKTFNEDVCYNLTKMGKFLISQFRDPNVRIVKFFFKDLLPSQNLVGAQLRIIDLRKKGFTKIVCQNKGDELGYIMIKLNNGNAFS